MSNLTDSKRMKAIERAARWNALHKHGTEVYYDIHDDVGARDNGKAITDGEARVDLSEAFVTLKAETGFTFDISLREVTPVSADGKYGSCFFCDGLMEFRIEDHKSSVDDGPNKGEWVVEDVPTLVCDTCGEAVYSAVGSYIIERELTKRGFKYRPRRKMTRWTVDEERAVLDAALHLEDIWDDDLPEPMEGFFELVETLRERSD